MHCGATGPKRHPVNVVCFVVCCWCRGGWEGGGVYLFFFLLVCYCLLDMFFIVAFQMMLF